MNIEIIHNTRIYNAGHYNPKFISNRFAKYEDEANCKTVIVEFKNGDIWKHVTEHIKVCPA